MFGLIVFTKAGIGDTNLKLYMRRYPVNSSGLDCKSSAERLWECKSLAAHQYMLEYPSGDGDGLISHLPSVRFSPRVPYFVRLKIFGLNFLIYPLVFLYIIEKENTQM